MTAQELLNAACQLFFEPNTAYYEPFALTHLNALLADTFEPNNRLRQRSGLEPLGEMPSLSALSSAIPYEDALVRGALIYGLASKLYFDDNDPRRQMYFHQQYVNGVNDADRNFVCVREVHRRENL
jgi:hypothetical protein